MALLPTFIMEWKSKLQLEVSENEVVIFFSTVHGPLKAIH